ncbi:hypothetical protein RFI_01430, partial [Reticulomyxa filosa]
KDDESSGSEEFYLCKKWHETKDFFYLVNQDRGIRFLFLFFFFLDLYIALHIHICYTIYVLLIMKTKTETISLLISDTKHLQSEKVEMLRHLRFLLFDWEADQRQREIMLQGKEGGNTDEKQRRAALLFQVLGTPEFQRDIITVHLCHGEFEHYVLTFDNILKMIAISLKIRSNTPVLLMGETGCGKTSLIKCLACAADVELEEVDIHGGFGKQEIRDTIKKCVEKLKQLQDPNRCSDDEKKTDQLWLFLDEVNTSPDIGWFKELICNHTLDGRKIPEEIKIIAACNPYRKRILSKEEESTLTNDPLSKYVYRVYPLCETMKEYVWMFGRLSDLDERQYIWEMTRKVKTRLPEKLRYTFEKSEIQFARRIAIAQKFLRDKLKDKAITSLRDVARCLKIFTWLIVEGTGYSAKDSSVWMERCINIALGLSYYFRLENSERYGLDRAIRDAGGNSLKVPLEEEVKKLCASFNIPSGVAMNKALKENLFILFLCIMTTTPIILVGNPGTSKTLSLQIIRNNLSHSATPIFRESLAKHDFEISVKPIHTIAFQCTRDSKPSGIKERWNQTMRHADDKQIKPMILLDEIGLAEHSKYGPLKILHQLLEDPKISFVGISNWSLDAAKMNRVVMHRIPDMKKDDLALTAREMLRHHKQILKDSNRHIANDCLECEIRNIAEVYHRVITELSPAFKPKQHFFGARDFYSLIRHQLNSVSYQQSFQGFMRNFGGVANDFLQEHLGSILTSVLGIEKREVVTKMNEWTPLNCVNSNLNDTRSTYSNLQDDNYMISRHCMIISEMEHSWQILLDHNILSYDDVFLFGSSFVHDKASTITYFDHLNKVINCMDTGKRVILYNLEYIHESLYDMLNQRYQKKPSGNVYCRVALGSESKDCFVKTGFKCVVIVNKADAYSPEMPIAFLNRFEKQLISYRSSLPLEKRDWTKKAGSVLLRVFGVDKKELPKLFPGFCDDTIASVVSCLLAQQREMPDNESKYQEERPQIPAQEWSDEELEERVLKMFRPLCRPEAIVEVAIDRKERFDQKRAKQETFLTFAETVDQHKRYANEQMLMVLTCDFECNLSKDWSPYLQKIDSYVKAIDFERAVENFFSVKNDSKDILLLQYRHTKTNFTQFVYVKHVLQSAHHRFYQAQSNQNKLVVLVVHVSRGSLDQSVPLIFSRKWKFVYVDSLSSIHPMQLDVVLTQNISDIVDSDSKELWKKNGRRALARLQFPHHVNTDNEIDRLNRLFGDDKFQEIRDSIRDRLKAMVSKGTLNEPIARILNKPVVKNVGSTEKILSIGSFHERYQNTIDKLMTMTLVNVLLALYENCYLIRFFEGVENESSDKNKLFIECLKNSSLVTVNDVTEIISRLTSLETELYVVRVQYVAAFPFSRQLHEWCNAKLSNEITNDTKIVALNDSLEEKEMKDPSDRPINTNNKITSIAAVLDTMLAGNDDPFKLLQSCDDENCKCYLLDLIRQKLSVPIETEFDLTVLQDVITWIIFAVCQVNKLSIALIESTFYCCRDVIALYTQLIVNCDDETYKYEQIRQVNLNATTTEKFHQLTLALYQYFISSSTRRIRLFFFPLKRKQNQINNNKKKNKQKNAASIISNR